MHNENKSIYINTISTSCRFEDLVFEKMLFSKGLSFLLLLFISSMSIGQEFPSIENFYPTDYDGENQNWAISQSSEKLIYVANSRGLLEFNGAFWKHYLSPNESIMRSVKVVDDLIYTGCYMEFGYWQKNALEELEYTSLSQQLDIMLLEDEEFWNITHIDEWMVFQSLNRIYIYNRNDGTVDFIDSKSRITQIFEIDQEIYFQTRDQGIFRINGGRAILFLDHPVVKENEVINIFNSDEALLILTKDNGFYEASDNGVIKSKTLSNTILSEVSIYDAIRLKNGNFALGTISDGLIILNENGGTVSKVNRSLGLINNTVLALAEDETNNIWLGLDNGISYIDANSRYEIHNEYNGVLGSVYASAIHDGNLYLGTNQGLFYRKLGSKDNFDFIKGTQGQVWCMKVVEETLFCGHHSGTFVVEENQVEKISTVQGAWSIAKIDNKKDLVLQGSYDGLYVLERTHMGWKLRNKLEGFNNSSRYFETLGNQIFVNHEYKGIFKLEVDSSYTKVKEVTIDATLKGSDSGIAKYNGELLYAYKEGIFKYDINTQNFVKDSVLSKAYTQEEYQSGKLIVDEKNNFLWVFTKSKIIYITPTGLAQKQRINNTPLTSQVRKGILGYENISSLGENMYLVGTTSGYAIIDLLLKQNEDFKVHIDKVKNGTSMSARLPQNINMDGNFKNNQNSFEMSFYTPQFNKHVSTLYQFQLEGIYNEWSDWSKNSTAQFENLPYGNYSFNVRSKIGDAVSSNMANYEFKIAKPWHISNLMLTLYVTGLLFLLLITHNLYKQFYKKQRQKLIAKNEKEMNLAYIQNEREIIKLRNEKLKVDFSSKSKELAASLMSIGKKNDLLRTIKDELKLARGEDAVKSVVNTINKSLRENDDWDFFQEAFNNADSEFLKNLKAVHPTLTPSDLKLCGYLRLNLSTKEMSKLLSITTRSVEIKRYRLRKKLNLEHEHNLVNYILEL